MSVERRLVVAFKRGRQKPLDVWLMETNQTVWLNSMVRVWSGVAQTHLSMRLFAHAVKQAYFMSQLRAIPVILELPSSSESLVVLLKRQDVPLRSDKVERAGITNDPSCKLLPLSGPERNLWK
jgi:hypothetical protein